MYNRDCDFYDYDDVKPYEVRQIEQKFEEAQGFMIELYRELTSDNPIDLQAVQFYMSELAGHLDVKDDGFGRLTIERDSNVIQFSGV